MAARIHRNQKINHRWTEEERMIVRRDYKGTTASTMEIAGRLGVSHYAVKGQAMRMGITFQDRHNWCKKEDIRLDKLITRYSVQKTAHLMHRSINSIVLRAKRLGISRRERNGWYTKLEVCGLLGVDHKWLQIRINCGALKAVPHNELFPPSGNGGSCWEIAETDLVKYLREYPQELMGRNVDIVSLVDLLGGLGKIGYKNNRKWNAARGCYERVKKRRKKQRKKSFMFATWFLTEGIEELIAPPEKTIKPRKKAKKKQRRVCRICGKRLSGERRCREGIPRQKKR